ncbi:hypothetical protein QFC20_002748 [Naganishia adeliensis]|uniref:Uncharacterized protein n=1 Tax=Naganishia adeliensis TaxID=92952 RepID=A0ACC2WJI4_9TREE|nr:hypothetical protein QFC20_002748 [Naganishia adeliensis]
MHINYPELVVPSVIGLVCVLYVLPWHIRVRNLATLSMSFWMISLNLIHLINFWNEGVENKAAVWCDISSALTVGYNYGLPLSHLLLARQLEGLTTLRKRSVLYDDRLKKTRLAIDWSMAVALPIIGILLHLTQQERRFYIMEGAGCTPATYWNAWGVLAMAFFPIAIAVAAMIYTVMALVNIYLRRQRMLSMVSADSQMARNQFLRLYIVSLAEIGTCTIRAIFNLISYTNGPSPLSKNTPPKPISLNTIGYIPKSDITDSIWKVMLLQWYTVTACSVIFFFCFATGAETVKFYHRVVRIIFPCIPDRKPDSFNTLHTASTSGFSSKPSNSTFSSSNKLTKAEYGDVMQLNYVQSPTGDEVASPNHYADSEPRTPGSMRSPALSPDEAQHAFFPSAVARPTTARIPVTLTAADAELDLESGRQRAVRLDSVGIDEDGEKRQRTVRHSQMPSKLSVQVMSEGKATE